MWNTGGRKTSQGKKGDMECLVRVTARPGDWDVEEAAVPSSLTVWALTLICFQIHRSLCVERMLVEPASCCPFATHGDDSWLGTQSFFSARPNMFEV